MDTRPRLTRIGIFYDGNFFSKVSNYYRHTHERKARIAIGGLHEFICHEVARHEGEDARRCKIVDAHYFRGRLSAATAEERGTLAGERAFDDVLMREGVVTHYSPLSPTGEKGIDVWLALEAFELSLLKRFDVIVLVACDGDYVPLVRKLHTLGARVLGLAWGFEWVDAMGERRVTRTSQALLDEVTYPVTMHQVIDDPARESDPLIAGLFLQARETLPREAGAVPPAVEGPVPTGTGERRTGRVQNLPEGKFFGFLTPDEGGDNLFFYGGQIVEGTLTDLRTGDPVEYELGNNEQGLCALRVKRLSP